MQIVTDSGTDLNLSPEERLALNVHVVPLVVTLDSATYYEGVDIDTDSFYTLLASTGSLPTTSQPSAGAFAQMYRELAAHDPEILSIHISSGLSGTVNSARTAADMVPEARVTVVDTKTLSAGSGWQVEAAARAAHAGWPLERILALVARISEAADSLFTLKELKYLIHGGRISHMKGLLASLLNIKPIIAVEKVGGTYVQRGQARAFKGAVEGLVALMGRQHAPGSALRVQVMHSNDPEAGQMLRDEVDRRYDCQWLPLGPMSLVLGAHTGPGMVGVAYAPQAAFADIP
jgi:DegV family protein with EDD domain